VLDELSRAATADNQSESYDISLGSADDDQRRRTRTDELMAQVNSALPTDEVQFDEDIIRENLDEILLMLIALHEETHGKSSSRISPTSSAPSSVRAPSIRASTT